MPEIEVEFIFNFLLILLPILAIIVIKLKDLLHATIVIAVEGIVLAVIFYMLKAPDIAIVQIAIGVGIITAIFLLAISKTRRLEE